MSNTPPEDVAALADWVTVAILGRPRGIRGEITAVSQSSHPERFASLKRVRLFGTGEEYFVEEVWDHKGMLIFKFEGIDTPDAAELLRGAEVRIPPSERVHLEPGEYFQSDIVGCELRDRASGRRIGKVTGWEEYGGPSLLQIDGGRFLVPFVKAICVNILPEEKLIEADLPAGLEEL
ncbi:MAG TPA: ribosome maturation factor RimM [Bryobacteraceae bacterium]|nr:ribosome maturation factor RimM [Bryobacteraceae bacterium]